MKVNEKLNISFSTLKPYLLMALFALCILNAGIVRADTNETNNVLADTSVNQFLA